MKNLSPTQKTLSVYWQHSLRYKRKLLTIYPLMVTAQLGEDILGPLLISSVFTRLASGNTASLQMSVIWPILTGVILLEAYSQLMWQVIIRMFWRTQDSIMRDMTMTVYDHLNTMSYRFFSSRFAGSLVNQANKFVGSFERLTDAFTWNVFKLLVSIIGASIVLITRAPIVVAAIWTISVIYVPLVWYFRRRQVPNNIAWAAAETKRTGHLADTISNILAVKSFANESLESGRMQERADSVHERSMDTMRQNMNQELVSGFVQRSIYISVIVLSISLAVHGVINAGVIYLSLNYTTSILRRLWDLNTTFRQLTRVIGDSRDMGEILLIVPEVADPIAPLLFQPSKGEVVFENVVFKYQERAKSDYLFENFNLRIAPGEKIGLVGPSGGGKTTITKLLQRFMDIQDGQILIDGVNIAKILQHDLRQAITYVPQEPLLFHRSLTENIAYGKLNATKKEIQAAAEKAHAQEFIDELPEGYRTLVGERGVKLSGGQRQRVAIARAMIKDAPILVLDEATSALDSESEKLIQTALWELMKGRTAIVIAHRLSTIQHMDRIIVLDKGKIVEQGTHADLKDRGGLYAKLWSHQSGGFLED